MKQLNKKIYSISKFILSRTVGIISILLRPFIKINENSILFWSWESQQYGCNPKAISDYLLTFHNREFTLYWSFKNTYPTNLAKEIIPLKWGSFKYLVSALKCKFLISNTRNNIDTMLFYKRKDQQYVMTWHAGMSLKKVEKDVEQSLNKSYKKRCLKDSQMCDLMISGSNFQTNLYKKSYWYDGEILNSGIPRNDIFFKDLKDKRHELYKSFGIPDTSLVVLYAPTFRSIFNPDIISFDWEKVKESIEKKFNKKVILLVRLHPNISTLSSKLKFKFDDKECFDVSKYPDMQELLIFADILITDYSSSMFDFSLTKKPCFLFVMDRSEYERGFYIQLSDLPFELSENEDELVNNILKFNYEKYIEKLEKFNKEIGSFEKGTANENLYNWLCNVNEYY